MPVRFTADQTLLVVVDVQGKLAQLMFEKETLFKNISRMISGAGILNMPVLWVVQNPSGLGATVPEISALFPGQRPIEKMSFSCCGSEDFMKALRAGTRKQVLLTGIETHVCIYQTAADLIRAGYEVGVIADAVSSRSEFNKTVGLERMKTDGVVIVTTEMVLFEMLQDCRNEAFKRILPIFK